MTNAYDKAKTECKLMIMGYAQIMISKYAKTCDTHHDKECAMIYDKCDDNTNHDKTYHNNIR